MDDRNETVVAYCRRCGEERRHWVVSAHPFVGRAQFDPNDLVYLEERLRIDLDGRRIEETDSSELEQMLRFLDEDEEEWLSAYEEAPPPSGDVEAMWRDGWSYADLWAMRNSGWEWEERYQTVACRGCDTPSFRLVRYEERRDRRNRSTGERTNRWEAATTFPPPAARQTPPWFAELPDRLQDLMAEVYRALDSGLLALPVVGVRMALEQVMQERLGDLGSLSSLLTAYCDIGQISPTEKALLEPVIESGNAAAHRGHVPTAEDLHHSLDILENLLPRTYVYPDRTAAIRSRTPPRPERPKARAKKAGEPLPVAE